LDENDEVKRDLRGQERGNLRRLEVVRELWNHILKLKDVVMFAQDVHSNFYGESNGISNDTESKLMNLISSQATKVTELLNSHTVLKILANKSADAQVPEEIKEEEKKMEDIGEEEQKIAEFNEKLSELCGEGDSKLLGDIKSHSFVLFTTLGRIVAPFLKEKKAKMLDKKSFIEEREKELRNLDFKIFSYIMLFQDIPEAIGEFKKDSNCMIHYINKDEMIRYRDENLATALKIKQRKDEQECKLKQIEEECAAQNRDVRKLEDEIRK